MCLMPSPITMSEPSDEERDIVPSKGDYSHVYRDLHRFGVGFLSPDSSAVAAVDLNNGSSGAVTDIAATAVRKPEDAAPVAARRDHRHTAHETDMRDQLAQQLPLSAAADDAAPSDGNDRRKKRRNARKRPHTARSAARLLNFLARKGEERKWREVKPQLLRQWQELVVPPWREGEAHLAVAAHAAAHSNGAARADGDPPPMVKPTCVQERNKPTALTAHWTLEFLRFDGRKQEWKRKRSLFAAKYPGLHTYGWRANAFRPFVVHSIDGETTASATARRPRRSSNSAPQKQDRLLETAAGSRRQAAVLRERDPPSSGDAAASHTTWRARVDDSRCGDKPAAKHAQAAEAEEPEPRQKRRARRSGKRRAERYLRFLLLERRFQEWTAVREHLAPQYPGLDTGRPPSISRRC